MELAKSFEPHAIEAKWYPLWESRGWFKPTYEDGARVVLHPASAAERHRHAAHGPRVPADADGRADPLSPDARRQHAVAGRHRPRRHRDADRRRAATEGAGQDASRSRPRAVRAARLGVEGGIRRRRSPTRCGASAPRPTGRASASRWTRGCRPRCSKRSCGFTTTASSIAASASSTGTRSSAPRCPISKSTTRKSRERSGRFAIRWPTAPARRRRRDDASRDDAGRRRQSR